MIGSVQGPWGVNVQSREYRHVDTRLKTGTLLLLYFRYTSRGSHCLGYNPIMYMMSLRFMALNNIFGVYVHSREIALFWDCLRDEKIFDFLFK